MTNIDKTMDENEKEIIDSEIDTDITENEEELDLDLSEDDSEDVESLKKKLQTLEAQKNHWKKKATEKATEPERKEVKPTVKRDSKVDNLNPLDLYALMEAKVPKEDVEEVIKASKLLGKSISEALQDPIVQGILKSKDEYRKTSEATATQTRRSGAKQVTDDEIIKKASNGEIPESGSDEAERLFWARRGGKR